MINRSIHAENVKLKYIVHTIVAREVTNDKLGHEATNDSSNRDRRMGERLGEMRKKSPQRGFRVKRLDLGAFHCEKQGKT